MNAAEKTSLVVDIVWLWLDVLCAVVVSSIFLVSIRSLAHRRWCDTVLSIVARDNDVEDVSMSIDLDSIANAASHSIEIDDRLDHCHCHRDGHAIDSDD